MNRVAEFIKKVNETTERNNVKESEWLLLEQEYLDIISDQDIPKSEKGTIWIKSRYEVVDMICSGIRYMKDSKKSP